MEKKPCFSILVVCLNPGDKLEKTLTSIRKQSFRDYEVLVKDGGSLDGTKKRIKELFADWKSEDAEASLRWIEKEDSGIYDAMNQAAELAQGEYVYYLNCGDHFYSDSVLFMLASCIEKGKSKKDAGYGIYYGDIYERLTGQEVCSNPRLDAFGCYRNVPCHQACFYKRELLIAHPFRTEYQVRADYEQFLWCFFTASLKEKVQFSYCPILIADYEGGGYSESKESKRLSAVEHKKITRQYMSRGQLFYFRTVMLLTLAPLRTWVAKSPQTAGLYNRLKSLLYRQRRKL